MPARGGFEAEPLTAIGVEDMEGLFRRLDGVEFVLVGPVAAAIRGASPPTGPVSIIPAPYRRNLERLERAMQSERVYSRVDGVGPEGQADLTPAKLTAEMLGRGQLRTLRLGSHDLDIEGSASGLPSYQDLLYEASAFEVVPGVKVEVACPEDIERYAHVRRTGIAPEITIRRQSADDPETAGFEAPAGDGER